jgi:hypothetical protein
MHGAHDNDLKLIMDGGPEPAHMLNSQTLITAARCLKPKGKILCVTDNQWYARFLAATMVKAVRSSKNLLQQEDMKSAGLRTIETFEEGIVVYAYDGRGAGGKEGVTWFDRLWQRSEKKNRFVLCLSRK